VKKKAGGPRNHKNTTEGKIEDITEKTHRTGDTQDPETAFAEKNHHRTGKLKGPPSKRNWKQEPKTGSLWGREQTRRGGNTPQVSQEKGSYRRTSAKNQLSRIPEKKT